MRFMEKCLNDYCDKGWSFLLQQKPVWTFLSVLSFFDALFFFHLQTNKTLLFKSFLAKLYFEFAKFLFLTQSLPTKKKIKKKKDNQKPPMYQKPKQIKLWLLQCSNRRFFLCYLIKMFLNIKESTMVLL